MYIFFLIMPLDSSIPGMVIGGDDRSPDDERIYQYIMVLQAPTPPGRSFFDAKLQNLRPPLVV